MNEVRISGEILDYYDVEVVKQISEKYGFAHIDALRKFLASKTYAMLTDARYGMCQFGPPGIFDIWESEQITGDPRNSVYIRED